MAMGGGLTGLNRWAEWAKARRQGVKKDGFGGLLAAMGQLLGRDGNVYKMKSTMCSKNFTVTEIIDRFATLLKPVRFAMAVFYICFLQYNIRAEIELKIL
jgi:hypothetical protein